TCGAAEPGEDAGVVGAVGVLLRLEAPEADDRGDIVALAAAAAGGAQEAAAALTAAVRRGPAVLDRARDADAVRGVALAPGRAGPRGAAGLVPRGAAGAALGRAEAGDLARRGPEAALVALRDTGGAVRGDVARAVPLAADQGAAHLCREPGGARRGAG